MKFNTDYYQAGISYIHHILNNLSKSFSNEENGQQNYICIPSTKKGKNFLRFDIHNTSGTDNMILFLSNQTVGAKIYDNKHKFLYDYSISQKDNIRIIQINFANGTGVQKKLELDPETGTYELVDLKETSYVSDIVNLNQYSDSIINSNLLMHTVNQLNSDGSFDMQVSYMDKNAKENLINMQEHPELLSIR